LDCSWSGHVLHRTMPANVPNMRSRPERAKRRWTKKQLQIAKAALGFTASREVLFHKLLDAGHEPAVRGFADENGFNAEFRCRRCRKKWQGRIAHLLFGMSPNRPCQAYGSGHPQTFDELLAELQQRIEGWRADLAEVDE